MLMKLAYFKSSQELLPKYTEQERQLTCPEGACVQAVFQQPELRGMSARARPRVTLRMVLVLFGYLVKSFFVSPPAFAVLLLWCYCALCTWLVHGKRLKALGAC